MEKLPKERLDALSKTANTQVEDRHSLATGAHVIVLSENLDEIQTEQFINSVEQDASIEFIEEDHRRVKRKSRHAMGYFSYKTAYNTILGIEIMHMIFKDQLYHIFDRTV